MDGAYCANFCEKAAVLEAFAASSAKILADELRLLAPAATRSAACALRNIFVRTKSDPTSRRSSPKCRETD